MRKPLIITTLILALLRAAYFYFYKHSLTDAPLICLDFMYSAEDWKDNPGDRYCIMKRIVNKQELKGRSFEEIEGLFGPSFYQLDDNGDGYIRYPTGNTYFIGFIFLSVEFKNNRATRMYEVID